MVSTFVGGWLSSYSSQQSDILKNNTQSQLGCQFADLYIRNASYNCSLDCSLGTLHNLTLSIANSGKIRLLIDTVSIQNTTGSLFELEIGSRYIDVGQTITLGNVSTQSCYGINNTIEKVIVSSPTCPNTAYDSLSGSQVNFLSC